MLGDQKINYICPSNIIKFQLQSISKMFLPNFLCVLTKIPGGTSFCRLRHGCVWGQNINSVCLSVMFIGKIQPHLVCELNGMCNCT